MPTLPARLLSMRPSVHKRQQLWGLIFVAPLLIGLALFAFYPMLSALRYSLTDYNLLESPKWVGLSQYARLLADPRFAKVMKNTVVYAVGSALPVWCLSLALALALVGGFRGRGILRTLYFAPVIVGGVVVSIVWRVAYHPYGLINATIGELLHFTPNWLTNPSLAQLAIIVVNVWQSIGFYMIIFIAGLGQIPQEFYDAARVDGATPLQSFRHVTLPLLKPTSLFVMVVFLISSFQSFTYQYVMTKGGPSDGTNVLGLYIYQTAFQFLNMGYASAISVVLFVIIMSLTLVQFRLVKSEDVTYR